MARLMSVQLTEDAVLSRRKNVTRRLGWLFLSPGDELDLCRKVMGRKKGDPLVRLANVRVVDVRREPLYDITDAEVAREGFTFDDLAEFDPGCPGCGDGIPFSPCCEPGRLASCFVRFFMHHMKCQADTEVTRIEWVYLDEVAA